MKGLYILFFLVTWNTAFTQVFVVSPFLQDAYPNSIRVLWESSATGSATLDWGADSSLGNELVSIGEQTPGGAIHDVQITPLEPNTTYFYQVSLGNEQSDVHQFRTPPLPSSENPFSFVAMSDMQKSNSNPNKFDEIVHEGVLDYFFGEPSEEIALVLIPGDLVENGNSYGQWADDFFQPAQDLLSEVPAYPVLGNHESNSSFFFQYFHLPENGSLGYEEHWWHKDYGNVRFIGLNSNSPFDGIEQLNWLEETLNSTCSIDDVDFVFAQLHHPHKSELWTPGESDFTGEVINLLEGFTANCGKPSIHFFGHTHGYSRGQSLEHKHLWINVATSGGAIDYWGDWPQFDYDEFEITTDDWGFVAVDVEAGDSPQFTIKRLSRGDNYSILDNVVMDSLVITRDDHEVALPMPESPINSVISPECVVLISSPFAGESPFSEHGATQWQVADTPTGFNTPIADVWERYRNIYFDQDTQTGSLIEQAIPNLPENTSLWWRVRHRDRNLNWSDWTEPTGFATSESLQGEDLILNGGAEEGLENWEITEGIAESLTAGECNGVNPHDGLRYFAVGGLCNESAVGRMHQTVDASAYTDSIESGNYFAHAQAWMSDWSGSDIPEMRLVFLDEFNIQISQTAFVQGPIATWTLLSIEAPIPSETRYIQLELKGTLVSGTDNDSYFDDISLRLGNTSDCDAVPAGIPNTTLKKESLKIYPNPSSGSIHVNWDELSRHDVDFRLVNAAGEKQVVLVERNVSGWTLSAPKISDGMYILIASDKKGRVASGEWVVQRDF